MKFSASRETLLKPLGAVIGVVERRQTMPILAHMLLVAEDGKLTATATDLEVELRSETDVDVDVPGEITVPGRKLYDICRALPESAAVEFSVSGGKATVRAGRSRFTLSTLGPADFPTIEEAAEQQSFAVDREAFRRLLEQTQFSMAQQDVRYYLNGLLLETAGKTLRAVATDGHRLALAELELEGAASQAAQIIVPRKGVLELLRLVDGDGSVTVTVGANQIRVEAGAMRLVSKLIDGRFPDYERVVPDDPVNVVKANRSDLRAGLQRAAILSNEKYRGVRLALGDDRITMQANNPEQEEAEEELEVSYGGEAMEIGFNVNYLLDALGAIDEEEVELGLNDANSSCLIKAPGPQSSRFVVMPMRL
jgi:DNA polymerase-3 subunit beta